MSRTGDFLDNTVFEKLPSYPENKTGRFQSSGRGQTVKTTQSVAFTMRGDDPTVVNRLSVKTN
jgi:hypothetical protein